MKTLAIDMSSAVGSVALLEETRVVAELDMPSAQGRTSSLFATLEQVREQSGWSWEDVDLFAAGRGPGRYSGMRVALTAVQGLALPGHRAVCAVSSGEALAYALADTHPDRHTFAVLGDARRDCIWFGIFARREANLRMTHDWQLAPIDALPDIVPVDALLVSSEWSRLQPVVAASVLRDRAWMPHDVHPAASWVGRVAVHRRQAGVSGDPLLPIYLHPAVKSP